MKPDRLSWIPAVLVVVILMVVIAVFCFRPQEESDRAALRIGAGKDMSGILLEQIMNLSAQQEENSIPLVGDNRLMDAFEFMDCCSNASQWALYSGEIDIGFFCSHIAIALINRDSSFSIYGPVILNCEVLASKTADNMIKSVAYPLQRTHLQEMIAESNPQVDTFQELALNSLMYAVEAGQIDAAVLDISTLQYATNQLTYSPVSDDDYISYCLVVRNDITDTPEFKEFLTLYNKAAAFLNTIDGRIETMGMDQEFWIQSRLKFLPLNES